MPDIKMRPKNELKIKKFDKASVYSQKFKNNLVSIKDKTYNYSAKNEENNEVDYGANQIEESSQYLKNSGIRAFNKYGKNSANITRNNIRTAKNNIKKRIETRKLIKTRENIAINNKSILKVEDKTKNFIKKAPKKIQQTEKAVKQSTKAGVKIAKKSYQVAKMTAKATIKTAKVAVKSMIKAIKAIISASKTIIAAILAGGWVAVLIVIIICLIAMICSSIYGIFFSNEKGVNEKSISSVISETNLEFTNKITEIQNNNEHDDYEINSNRAEWKDVISVYAVMISGGKEQSDTILLNDSKIQKLKDVFWEMNTIDYRVEDVEKNIEIINDDGTTQTEAVIRKVLYIDIQSKSVDEMINIYNFNENQIKQIAELRDDKYNDLWSNVLYGSSGGNTDIVEVARKQLGNVGGQPYWSWYGFTSRVSWCACFVSYCANECGFIQSGIIPKFASCQNEGISWFKTCGLWQEGGYIPKSRRNNFL